MKRNTAKNLVTVGTILFTVCFWTGMYALIVSCVPSLDPTTTTTSTLPAATTTTLPDPAISCENVIKGLVEKSTCAKYSWKNRGKAPMGYMQGMALSFAKSYKHVNDFTIAVAQAKTTDDVHDVLSWYNSDFKAIGMNNDKASSTNIRHVYDIMIGLGMRESSGKHCVGRDTSASNTSSDTAEAGLFQASWNSHSASPLLPKLMDSYRSPKEHPNCYSDIFSQNVACTLKDWENFGSGDGMFFQNLEKECPVFAAEYTAILLRKLGGSKGHWGPIRRKEAELRPECDEMLATVQDFVDTSSSCTSF